MLRNHYQYWILPVLRPYASALAVVQQPSVLHEPLDVYQSVFFWMYAHTPAPWPCWAVPPPWSAVSDLDGANPRIGLNGPLSSRRKNLGIGNGGGKRGRGNSPPLSTVRTRYGNSVSTPESTRTCKTQHNSPKRKPIRYFSFDPTSSIRTRLRTPFFAGVLRGNTIRGNTTRNSERKMALREGL